MPLSHGPLVSPLQVNCAANAYFHKLHGVSGSKKIDLSRCDCAIATLFMPLAHRLLLAEREFYDFASCAAWRNGHRLRFQMVCFRPLTGQITLQGGGAAADAAGR